MDGSPIPVWQVAVASLVALAGAIVLYPRQPFTGNFGLVLAAVGLPVFGFLLAAHVKRGEA